MDETKDLTILITAICIGVVNVIGAVFAGLSMLSASQAKAKAELAALNSETATRKLAAVHDDMDSVRTDLRDVKTQTDGLTKALVKSEKIVAFAAGKEEGIAVEKAKNGG